MEEEIDTELHEDDIYVETLDIGEFVLTHLSHVTRPQPW